MGDVVAGMTRDARNRYCLPLSDSTSRRRLIAALFGIITAALVAISTTAIAATPNLASVVIRGSTVYDPPALFAIYRRELGKPVTREGAAAIATALAAKYEHDGYPRPQVELDDALLAEGVLRIDEFEARISEVRISGDPGPHRARLESLGSELRAAQPLAVANLQSTVERMRGLPGLRVSASTQRDETAGPNLYRLDVDTSFKRLSGAVRLTNRGTDEAGPVYMVGQVVANGLLGGRTNLGALFSSATDSSEYRGAGALAGVGVGTGQLSFTAFRSWSNPHEPVVDLDDLYLRDNAVVGFTRPIAGSERMTLSLSAGLALDDLEIQRSGSLLRDERVRTFNIGTIALWQHGATQWAGSAELIQGLDGLGSELVALDLVDDPRETNFTLARLSLTRLTRLNERWSVRLDALGQLTGAVLPYDEQFKIGGDRLGRGFEVAEVAGDQGLGAKVEVRRELPGAPQRLGRAGLYGFYDIGAAWKNDEPGRESAATAGLGFAVQGARLSGSLELAQPLTHPDVEGRKDLRLFAELVLAL